MEKFRRKNPFYILSFVVSVFIVCSTPYQRESALGGYSETPYENNIWLVSFRGNGYTGKGQVHDFVILRAAELTLENGYSHFIVINAKNGNEVINLPIMPGSIQTQGTMQKNGNFYNYQENSTYQAPQTIPIQKHERSILIKMGTNEGLFLKGLDAKLTRNRLASMYRIP